MLPFDASSVSLKYLVHGAVAIVLSFLITADVFAQAQFYQGKTITSAADSMTKRNREWLDKGLGHLHASIEVPKGEKHRFAQVPDLETFATSERDRKVLALQRAFRVTGQPFVLPPKTAKEHVQDLQAAFRKTYQDPNFHKEYKKFTADERTPLLPEKLSKKFPRSQR